MKKVVVTDKAEESKELVRQEPGKMSTYGDLLGQYSEGEIGELLETTGTENKPDAERRPPLYLFNVDTIDDQGNKIDPGKFWNPQTGEQFDHVNCAFLGFREVRQRDHRDQGTGSFILDCRSFDRISGFDYATGEEKRCDKCEYRYGKKGERKACTLHMRFMGWDLDRNEFFAYFAKRSGYIATNRYLERTFFRQLVNPKTGRRSDIPLYLMRTIITLQPEVGMGRTYYVPAYECGGPLPKEVVLDLIPAARSFKKISTRDDMEQLDAQLSKGGSAEVPPPEEANDDDIPF